MLLKHCLNISSVLNLTLLILSIVELAMAYSVTSETRDKFEQDTTVTYFRISEIILPPMPSLQVLAFIFYVFLVFLHGYKRKRLFFAMNPENRSLRQQPVKEKDDGFVFFTAFKSVLISLFHVLVIFFTTKAVQEYERINNLNNSTENNDLISRVNAVFGLNIVSIVLYYISVLVDYFVRREETKLYLKLLYSRA